MPFDILGNALSFSSEKLVSGISEAFAFSVFRNRLSNGYTTKLYLKEVNLTNFSHQEEMHETKIAFWNYNFFIL